jgi:hypothetical protein
MDAADRRGVDSFGNGAGGNAEEDGLAYS